MVYLFYSTEGEATVHADARVGSGLGPPPEVSRSRGGVRRRPRGGNGEPPIRQLRI